MTLRTFTDRARACTDMAALERLFIDERKFVHEPDWRFVKVWKDNEARIINRAKASATFSELPF